MEINIITDLFIKSQQQITFCLTQFDVGFHQNENLDKSSLNTKASSTPLVFICEYLN